MARSVATGRNNREAAAELFMSPDTINTHLRHIFTKLGIHSGSSSSVGLAADHQPGA